MFFTSKLQNGWNQLVSPGDMQYLNFGVWSAEAGQNHIICSDNQEMVIIVLSGRVDISGADINIKSFGGRTNVFQSPGHSLYVPNNIEIKLTATEKAEIAVVSTVVEAAGQVHVIKPEQVAVKSVGIHNWRRDVRDIVDKRVPASRLIVGETINAPGNWSSWPPHKHDVDDYPVEIKQEEVYFYKLMPSNSFGFQRIFTDDKSIDSVYTIEQNSLCTIDKGYHPVAAAPGTQVYYLWALAGERRELIPHDCPDYAWMKNAESIIKEIGR